MLSFNDFILKINEGLIRTVDIDKTVDMIDRYLIDSNLIYNTKQINRSIKIFLDKTTHIKNKSIVQLMNNMGWFPSHVTVYKNIMSNKFKYKKEYLENDKIDITFESKFDDIVEDHYTKLYHITLETKVNKILKNGLSPKANYRLSYHPDRVYLTIKPDHIKDVFMKIDILSDNKKEEYVILEIDNMDNDIPLYFDPNYADGFYTYDNIHPNKIKKIKTT